MKPLQPSENDGGLDRVLREWRVEAPLPPRFQEQVWQRIAREESQAEVSFWSGLARLIEVVLPRPQVAGSYVAALMLIGMAAGATAAHIKASHLSADLSTRYLQSLNPYLKGPVQP